MHIPTFPKYLKIVAAAAAVALLIGLAVFLYYNPRDKEFGFTYYIEGTTASRKSINLPPSNTFVIYSLSSNAIISDSDKLGSSSFQFPLTTGYFRFTPYDYSMVIIDIYQGGGEVPSLTIGNVKSVRSAIYQDKCRFGIKDCSWPGLYVFTDQGEVQYYDLPGKTYAKITKVQR